MIQHEIDSRNKTQRIFVTSDGVRLIIKPVSGMLVLDAQKTIKEPQPPMWHNTDKNRDEPNPNHPDYLLAMQEYREKVGDKSTDTMLLRGIHVAEPLPDGVFAISAEEWTEEIEYLGIEVPQSGFGRRLAWLKYYILANNDDLLNATKQIGVASGSVTEEAVDAAVESFRANEGRPTLVEVPTES